MSAVALMYHAITGDVHRMDAVQEDDRSYAVTAEVLAEHLAMYAGKNVVITFDDGDAGWYLEALPVLERFSIKALFFVTPNLIETPGYCDWKALAALLAAGHEIGAHGLSHQFLPDLSDEACRHELFESKRILEKKLHMTVRFMSFPGGRYGKREVRLAREAGYAACYTSFPGRVDEGQYCRPRVAVRADSSVAWLHSVVRGDRLIWWRMQLAYSLKRLVKTVLGNRGYHELYRFLRG